MTRGNGGNGQKADATAFWRLLNGEGRQAGVSVEAARGLAGKGNWAVAYTELQAMITGAAS